MSEAVFAERKSETAGQRSNAADRSARTSLRIGEPDDQFEREADRVADEIMADRRPKMNWSLSGMSIAPSLQRKCACGGAAGSSGECEECKKKEDGDDSRKMLQRKAAGPVEVNVAPPIVHDVLNSPGRPLDRATREFFEPRFGYELGRVRLHTDTLAGDSTRAVHARGYSVGQHIVFPSGEYSFSSREGRRLLAHELAHTLQQRAVLSRQRSDAPDHSLPPHDPHPKFAPLGACYGSAICTSLKPPSQTTGEVVADPANKEKRDKRRELCLKTPPDPACTADGHGAPAQEAAKLLHNYDPSRPVPGAKMLVDKDIPPQWGAVTMPCSDFMPPVSGGPDCIAIPEDMEKGAAQFNNTMDPSIGGMERGKWREQTLEKLVHEAEHTRFRAVFRLPGTFAAIKTSSCATSDTVSAMNELSSMLTEFALRIERIRTSVGLSAEDREKEMEEWREHRILGMRQSITVSLRTVRCACNCQDADRMIKEAVEFTTASWTVQDKNALHKELRDQRWKDLDLRWPFVPAIPRVP